MSKNWIDVSVPLHTGMVHWPTDPSVHIERFADMDKGAICNVSKVDMCVHDGVECHQVLLGAGVWIIEGLDLTKVKPGKYDMICLPVKIRNSDGAPARAILRQRTTAQ